MKHLGLQEFIILNLVMVGLVSRLWYVVGTCETLHFFFISLTQPRFLINSFHICSPIWDAEDEGISFFHLIRIYLGWIEKLSVDGYVQKD